MWLLRKDLEDCRQRSKTPSQIGPLLMEVESQLEAVYGVSVKTRMNCNEIERRKHLNY